MLAMQLVLMGLVLRDLANAKQDIVALNVKGNLALLMLINNVLLEVSNQPIMKTLFSDLAFHKRLLYFHQSGLL